MKKGTMTTSASKSLIRDAMVHLKKRNGASFAQIRKHLESNYAAKLDANKRKLLSSALKSMVQSGSVEKKGAVYKLGVPTAQAPKGPAEIDVPSRRRRRRKSSKSLKIRHKGKGGRKGRRHRRRRSKRTKRTKRTTKGHRRHRRSRRGSKKSKKSKC